jgi:hypothetical protein
MKATGLSMIFCFVSYLTLSILAVRLYGSNVNVNLFENLNSDPGFSSILVRVLFLIIFFCNIPFLFFPGKISVINAIYEYRIQAFSKNLEIQIAKNKGETEEEPSKQFDPLLECETKTYYIVCFTYLAGIVAGALAVNDLNFIFGMIAAFNESNLNFVFPGIFFLKAAFYSKNK